MENPFRWDYLTAPINETPIWGPLSIAYLVLFSAVFLISAFAYIDARRRFADHKLKRDTVRRFASWFMWSAGIALFFFGIRATQTPMMTLERRIWMYLSFLAFLILVAWVVRFLRTDYPAQLAAFDRSRERRAWQHAARRPGGQAKSSGRATNQTAAAARRRRVAR